jgi:hypothetical protein
MSMSEIAKERGMAETTIVGHLERMTAQGIDLDLEHLRPEDYRLAQVREALGVCGDDFLKPVREFLGTEFTYTEIRLARIFLRQDEGLAG